MKIFLKFYEIIGKVYIRRHITKTKKYKKSINNIMYAFKNRIYE